MIKIKAISDISVASDDTSGITITGWATTYNTVDQDGDTIRPGAFTAWLSTNPSTPLLYGHDYDIENILGRVTYTDDPMGLRFTATIDPALPHGSTAIRLISTGVISSVSIGFASDAWDRSPTGGYIFKIAKIRELSITPFPANLEAKIDPIKHQSDQSTETIRDILRTLKSNARYLSSSPSVASPPMSPDA